MESIGQTIKTRRAERGLTLGEAHEATKITMQNLAAIEEDRFDAFPNRVYARAFLRDYANYLGLDSGDMLQRYEQEWGTPLPIPVRKGGSKTWAITAGAVVLIAIVGLAASFYWKNAPKPPRPVKPTEAEVIPVTPRPRPVKPHPVRPNPLPVATAEPIAPVTGTPPALGANTGSAAGLPPKPPAKPKKVVVQIRAARGSSWLTVRVDGRLEYTGLMQAGQTAAYQGNNNIWVRFGNAGNVDVTANGKHIGAMGAQGQVVNKSFTKPVAVPPRPPLPLR